MRQLLILIFLFTIVLLHSASAQSLVGSWEIKTLGITMHLKEDGTGSLSNQAFQWKIENELLVLQDNSGRFYYSYAVSTSELDITDLSTGITLNFTRSSGTTAASNTANNPTVSKSPAPAAGKFAPELVGKWCYMSNVHSNDGGSMSNECITLYENGTYDYYSESSSSGTNGGYASQSSDNGTWTASGSTLQVQSNSKGPASYNFQKQNHPKNGDPMLIIEGRAFVTYYNKAPW